MENPQILKEISSILQGERRIEENALLSGRPAGSTLTRDEIRSINNILMSKEEEWILNNATPLYIIEKASSVIQPANITPRVKVDDIFKKINKQLQGVPDLANIQDSSNPVFRLIYFNEDFIHNGSTSSRGFQDLDRQSEKLRNKVRTSLSPTQQHFCLILSLSFGAESGGHFGAVIGTTDSTGNKIVYIFDPYFFYYSVFEEIVSRTFDDASMTPTGWRNIQIRNFTDTFVEINLQSALRYRENSAPSDDKEKVIVQDARGQDHFCWAWCNLFIHVFMLSNCNIETTKNFFEESFFEEQDKPLVAKIKTYIMFLARNNIINSRTFLFQNCFKYLWHSSNPQNFIELDDSGREVKTAKKPVPYDFDMYEIIPAVDIKPVRETNIFELFNLINFIDLTKVDYDNDKILSVTFDKKTRPCREGKDLRKEIVNYIKHIKGSYNEDPTILEICENSQNLSLNPALTNAVKDPDEWLEHFLTPPNFNENRANLDNIDCSKPNSEDQSELIHNLFSLDEYEGDKKKKRKNFCEYTNDQVNSRNKEKDTILTNLQKSGKNSPSCDSSLTSIFYYQAKVIGIMREKIQKYLDRGDDSARIEGLLVWYGTGTGKTLTASLVAKFLSFCRKTPVIENCYIISPKSAVKNFVRELEKENIFCDKITTGLTKATMYYRAGNIKIYSHSNFSNTYNIGNRMDPSIDLSKTLFIIDEAHNFINIEGQADAPNTQFMLSACSRAKQVMLLTATPMLNSPYDMATILAMLNGNVQPMSKDDFRRLYSRFNGEPNLVNVCTDKEAPITLLVPDQRLGNPEASPEDIRRYFDNKIIFFESPTEGTTMPPYKDIRACVHYEPDSSEFQTMNSILTDVSAMQRTSNFIENIDSFGSRQRDNIWSSFINIKTEKIRQIIENREVTSEYALSVNPDNAYVFDPKNIKYKYIIFSSFTENIDKIRRYLTDIVGINPNIIGEIHGSIKGDSTETRSLLKDRFNRGELKIMLISKAAEEGVDFKRASVVICAEAVYNWSEYVQIRGRAVRTGAHKPYELPKNPTKQDLEASDYLGQTRVANVIESYIIILNQRAEVEGVQRSSWDLISFRQMYKKRFEIEHFTNYIRRYFYQFPQLSAEEKERTDIYNF